MNPLQALYTVYNQALEAGLVDVHKAKNQPALLPIYHDNKRSNGNDIIEVLLNEKGEFLDASWIPKDDYIQFPVSELSIGRSSGIAPQPLVDKMTYVSKAISKKTKKIKHHEAYLEQLSDWVEFEKENPNILLHSISKYLLNPSNDILQDIINALFEKVVEIAGNGNLKVIEDSKEKNVKMADVFVTFSVEYKDTAIGVLNVTDNLEIHKNFIKYTEKLMATKPKDYCNISGECVYISSKHRGLLGNAKIISGSNRYEIYRGRFQDNLDLIRVGFEASQKIFLMLKYFLENGTNSRWLNSGAYLVNWFSTDIENTISFDPSAKMIKDDFLDDLITLEDLPETDTAKEFSFGGSVAKAFSNFITGNGKELLEEVSYNILLLDKTSNGRIAIKYFKTYNGFQLAENVGYWYETMNWPYYSHQEGRYKNNVIPLFALINTLYGEEQETGNHFRLLGDRDKKIAGNMTEETIRCIMERRPLAKELAMKAWSNAKNRVRYKKYWTEQLRTDCIVIQKYFKDLPYYNNKYIPKEKNLAMLDYECNDRSYLYGRLLAVYDKIEKDAQYSRTSKKEVENQNSSDDSDYKRPTNASRLWAAFIDRPTVVHVNLSKKIQPYLLRLKNNRPGNAIYLEKLLGQIINQINKNNYGSQREALDEMFLFGYYAQNQDFYRPKNKGMEENNNKVERE